MTITYDFEEFIIAPNLILSMGALCKTIGNGVCL